MEANSLKETNQKIARERDRYLAIFQSMAEPAFVVASLQSTGHSKGSLAPAKTK